MLNFDSRLTSAVYDCVVVPVVSLAAAESVRYVAKRLFPVAMGIPTLPFEDQNLALIHQEFEAEATTRNVVVTTMFITGVTTATLLVGPTSTAGMVLSTLANGAYANWISRQPGASFYVIVFEQ